MQIKKEYKFYYGHRNQELTDKCFNPHGHDARLFIVFNVMRTGNISTLFNNFDEKIEPYLKNEFDHRFAIDVNDPLLPYFKMYEADHGKSLGLNVLPMATSVENMCFYLFREITTKFGFDVARIEYQETRTSTVIYDQFDYEADVKNFPEIIAHWDTKNAYDRNHIETNKTASEAKGSGDYVSLFDYYGKAAGPAVGKKVYAVAIEKGIFIDYRTLNLGSGAQQVCLYPRTFLEANFPLTVANKVKK